MKRCTFATSWQTKFPNLQGLDGELKARIMQACPTLPLLRSEIDCPEFWTMFELGFLVGFQFFEAKEHKRHLKDAVRCAEDIQAVEEMTGLKLRMVEIPSDFWFKVR